MFFKNLKIKNNLLINTIASTCFGVFLIHANSDTMRRWLWTDMLHNVLIYESKYYFLHAIISVLCVFIICSFIEWIRIRIFTIIDKSIAKKVE